MPLPQFESRASLTRPHDDRVLRDPALRRAAEQIASNAVEPLVTAFFDPASSTVSYVVSCPNTGAAAIIDSVLDYDPATAMVARSSADRLGNYVTEASLAVEWHLETHIHADHMSAAHLLRGEYGGRIGAGAGIAMVQDEFSVVFDLCGEERPRADDFDHLFADGEAFFIGDLPAVVLDVPGHTPADVAYVIGNRIFVGDTLFMPDYGTARADFPRGDASQLYRSIRRLLSLPGSTRLQLCHDYMAPGRNHHSWECSIAEQRAANVHVRAGVEEAEFVAMRTARDTALSLPALYYPAVQANIRAGRLPRLTAGHAFIKIPIRLDPVLPDAGENK